ncbi:MAG TPA: hypothetical protein VIL74_08265 [Pyrinomonadaceae bacterium]
MDGHEIIEAARHVLIEKPVDCDALEPKLAHYPGKEGSNRLDPPDRIKSGHRAVVFGRAFAFQTQLADLLFCRFVFPATKFQDVSGRTF